jgi:hypothetical protein
VHAIPSVNENKVLWADVAHRNFNARGNLGDIWECGWFKTETDFVEIRTLSNCGHILDRVINSPFTPTVRGTACAMETSVNGCHKDKKVG